MNSVAKAMNSILPVSLTKATNASALNASKAAAPDVSMGFPGANIAKLTSATPNSGSAVASASQNTHVLWIVGALILFLGIFAFYYKQISTSLENWYESLSNWINGTSTTRMQAEPQEPSPPPVDSGNSQGPNGAEPIVESILPPAKDVFTVSKNDYSYYDAAPLCKALGAELATYDEVKQAWKKGADWCNYGWVKGQMAVYPTQKSTYQELQQGPEEQKGACGRPGVNGGYFDNPELKFGVTCSGPRPAKGSHDVTANMAGSALPLTASGLEFEKKVQQFKSETDNLGIMPFNREKWSS